MKALLDARTELDARDSRDYTSLLLAAEGGHEEVVAALVEALPPCFFKRFLKMFMIFRDVCVCVCYVSRFLILINTTFHIV